MRERGLLSRLGAGSPRRSDPLTEIAEHLRALLNTRLGSSAASSDFGIVDFNDVVHLNASAVPRITASIKQAIQQFEPRLKNVSVAPVADDDGGNGLKLEISAQLVDPANRRGFRLQARLLPGGKVDLR
jgi:type VI secretion system protein